MMHAHLRCGLHRQSLGSLPFICTRGASVSSRHPFPFPTGTNPTPHAIFHLPRSASQDEIKTRYYELVKLYHPDTTHCQHGVSPSVHSARFRAITHAYGVLRGRHGPHSNGGARSAWDDYESRDEVIRAELRRRSRRSGSSSSSTATADGPRHAGNADGAQLWYLIAFVLAGMIATMSSVSSHMDRVERHTQSAAANLAQARKEAQVYGMERRKQIRERVRAFHEARETENGTGSRDGSHVTRVAR